MERALLADFLRARRAVLQPEDVGLPRGPRRRASGLRRSEVADLAGISTDYYCRIEQQRGPLPSDQILAALARALLLNPSERDHLFRVGGQPTPRRSEHDAEVSPTVLRIMERMSDTPVILITPLGEALAQNRLAIALLGDYTQYTGLSRYLAYRWFTDEPRLRYLYPVEDHPQRGRVFAAELRDAHAADPQGPAAEIVDALLTVSPEFASVWRMHEVGVVHHRDLKSYRHPELGELALYCQLLMDPDQHHMLHVFTAAPGSPSEEKLQRLTSLAEA